MTTPYFEKFLLPEAVVTGFEGPEKRLEIDFKHSSTTTLLNVIPKLLEIATNCDLTVEFAMFYRKNYLFHHKQKDPHNRWEDEVSLLNTIFDGNAYTIGPTSGDHWYLYLADYSDTTRVIMPEKTLEIMMHKLDEGVASQFYRKEGTADKDKFAGVADLIEDSETDEFNFSPCGYSMNGLNKQSYYTIHVTPETICSYASFETNLSLGSYSKLIAKVLALFKPNTFTVTFFSEKATAVATADPYELELEGYVIKHKSFSELEGNCDILLVNYESLDYASRERPQRKLKLPSPSVTQSIIY